MSNTTMTSSTPSGKASSKSAKHTKTVVLRLSPKVLSRFPSDTPSQTQDSSQPSSQHADTPTIIPPETEWADKTSDSNATPLPSTAPTVTDDKSLAPPTTEGGKKKGPKTGVKRSAAQAVDNKPKGRPGPKKKPRLADGTIDRTTDSATTKKGPAAGPAPVASHKLGPKANTGAINAGLRALDRTGKPCRKWERKGFHVKSFTGVAWSVGSWATPQRDSSTFSGDVKSDSSSDVKPNMESSVVPSDRSNSGEAARAPSNGLESSPAPELSAAA